MRAEQLYLFDLQGYIVLKQVVHADVLESCNAALDRFEQMDPAAYPAPLQLGDQRTDSTLFISNILEGDAAFRPLIDLSDVAEAATASSSPRRSPTARARILPGVPGARYITVIAQDTCPTGRPASSFQRRGRRRTHCGSAGDHQAEDVSLPEAYSSICCR